MQKFCNDNIVYYVWRTKAEKLDQENLVEKKKELNAEIQRWETYLKEARHFFYKTYCLGTNFQTLLKMRRF